LAIDTPTDEPTSYSGFEPIVLDVMGFAHFISELQLTNLGASSATVKPVGAQWELPGAVAGRDQSHGLGFLLNPDPQAGILFGRRFRFESSAFS
jgi:hypothetical protein